MYDELNVIAHTWATDYSEERCDLVSPLGLIVAAWGVLGGSGSLWSPLPLPPALE